MTPPRAAPESPSSPSWPGNHIPSRRGKPGSQIPGMTIGGSAIEHAGTRHLQNNQFARLAERYDGEKEEADDETRKSPKVTGPKDQQTVPPAHYVSPVSLVLPTLETQFRGKGRLMLIETRQGGPSRVGLPET